MSKIFLVSGEVRSGKTTRLLQWASSHTSIDGIVEPVINEKRYFYQISSKILKPLDATDSNSVSIGNHTFNKIAFEWARTALLGCIDKPIVPQKDTS